MMLFALAAPQKGSTMNLENMQQAVTALRSTKELDNLSQQLWLAWGTGDIDDCAAEAISASLVAKKKKLTENSGPEKKPGSERRSLAKRPSASNSIKRRRLLAASGAVPGAIAANFTTGEIAALTVIARECQRSGTCQFFMDQIAAIAGVSRTTVRNAFRHAQRLGLIDVQERRNPGRASETNIVSIISREWSAWLRLGGRGCRKLQTTNTALDSRTGQQHVNSTNKEHKSLLPYTKPAILQGWKVKQPERHKQV